MKRSGVPKFPHSAQLFRFCQKVLCEQKGSKIHDQEVGNILAFNPSDCSHWKRGEKNVRSVFALAKLAETLQLEPSLIHDLAMGSTALDEAYFEYKESLQFFSTIEKVKKAAPVEQLQQIRSQMLAFVDTLHQRSEFATAPLYLPEIFRFFPFILTQPTEMMDKLTRILRTKPGQYTIQFKKGDLKTQVRMSMTQDLARILLQGERGRFSELGACLPACKEWEELLFTANLLVPKALLLEELVKLDTRKNVVAELATLFWVPKSLIGFQLQDFFRSETDATKSSIVEQAM
jgi:hypothetical protein